MQQPLANRSTLTQINHDNNDDLVQYSPISAEVRRMTPAVIYGDSSLRPETQDGAIDTHPLITTPEDPHSVDPFVSVNWNPPRLEAVRVNEPIGWTQRKEALT